VKLNCENKIEMPNTSDQHINTRKKNRFVLD